MTAGNIVVLNLFAMQAKAGFPIIHPKIIE
jgi:hypothetical protein